MNLQKLAEKINERVENHQAVGSPSHLYIGRHTEYHLLTPVEYYVTESDEYNGSYIIWCLDRLEELGKEPHLYKATALESEDHEGEYCCRISRDGEVCKGAFSSFLFGKTRAEAVTLALAKALGVEDE
jgi:hypothetical protein